MSSENEPVATPIHEMPNRPISIGEPGPQDAPPEVQSAAVVTAAPRPQVPTVGRQVYYYDSFGAYDRGGPEGLQLSPKPATITYVHDDGTLDISALYPSRGQVKFLVRVAQATGAEVAERDGKWDWPVRS